MCIFVFLVLPIAGTKKYLLKRLTSATVLCRQPASPSTRACSEGITKKKRFKGGNSAKIKNSEGKIEEFLFASCDCQRVNVQIQREQSRRRG